MLHAAGLRAAELLDALDRHQGERSFDEQFEIGLDQVLAAVTGGR